MISLRSKFFCLCAITLALLAAGCLPSASDPLDEQREPHFLTGKARVNAMDYEGAVAAFEKALEVNPRSASAHFELGLLYEDKVQDYAAAIYHFDRYLKLRPGSDYAEIVKQRVVACKQELAKTVSLVPVQQNVQRDLERLTDENRELRQKVEAWQAYYNNLSARPADVGQPTIVSTPMPTAQPVTAASQPALAASSPSASAQSSFRTIGTYSVKAGDTPASIARKYGIKLDSLLAANPGLDPRRMQVGQTLNIPAH